MNHRTDHPVSPSADNPICTTQIGKGGNAADTDRLVAQVEPIREAAQTASEQPSLLAEMR